ncbi:MAG: hypothetical protein PUC73_07630 [Lachnospiraceae bacterium]|nr:hypothetical protein [Lachnospiraceae bacterium]
MKRVYQIVYLFLVFCGAVVFFGSRVGETVFEGKSETVPIAEAAFPTVSILTCGEEINCLYGYSSNLSTILNREDMIPIGADGIFELKINEYEMDIRRLKYEVLEVSSETEIDAGTINAFEKQEACKIVRIKLKADLKEGTEYAVKVTLIGNTGKRMYYYFRIKQYQTPRLQEKLAFIRTFSENARSADTAANEAIIPYLETKPGASADSFHYVDIYDSYKTVAWGELTPVLATQPVISVTEFYEDVMTAVARYCVSIDAGYGAEQYFVEEYFRIRYLGDVVHLLNYERHTESLFEVANASLSQSDLKIGIASAEEMELYPNADHSMVAFVRNGTLYCYSLAENTLAAVFPAAHGSLQRMCSQKQLYDIRVLKMENNGNITFLVSGYMNRGVYEGRVGLFVYRYYAKEQRLEELLYIPVNTTYQILKEELGEFAYFNEYDVFYFMVNGGVYAYNLVTEELTVLAEDVRDGEYVYSVTEEFMAYQEHEKTDKVDLLYPESGKIIAVEPAEGEYIRLLGKSEENLIYGYGREEDLCVNEDGRVTYAMYKVEIADASGQVKKVYEKEGYFVEEALTTGNVIRLERLVRDTDGSYKTTSSDYILNQDNTEQEKISLVERVTDRMLTEYYISFPYNFVMEELPKEVTVLYTVMEKDTTLRINEMERDNTTYYTYYYGMIDGIYDAAGDAILAADMRAGTVINEKGKIVWERGTKPASASVPQITGIGAGEGRGTLQAALQMMLSGKGINAEISAEEVRQPLQQVLKRYTNADVAVLTGATLDEVLYFVWKGQPVLAMKESGDAVVITAYSSGEITYYDPGRSRSITVEKEQAEKLFEDGGRTYISFLY